MSLFRIIESSELTGDRREALLRRVYAEDRSAYDTVRTIIDDVRKNGEEALLRYTETFDRIKLDSITVASAEFDRAEKAVEPELKRAFERAAENIALFHQKQRDELVDREIAVNESRLGFRYIAMNSVGIYVPGGKALYPSSVLMGAIPAQIAGTGSRLLITPPAPDGSVDPVVLFCAKLAGVTRILKVGGAQGIAGAAFGVAGDPVELIIGPGNRYVTAAKSILAAEGLIRIDAPAGPSEVIVIADTSANPKWIASDLLSQAEHGDDSPAILLTTSRKLAESVADELARGIEARPERRAMKETSIRDHSYAIVFDALDDAIAFSNDYAPEHLEICTEDPERDLKQIRSAGSVFLGHYAPVALGDYFSGTNHTLPTGGMAKFYSGLGIDSFLKRITYQFPTRESLRDAKDAILIMSKAEGFDQEHGHSVAVRFEEE